MTEREWRRLAELCTKALDEYAVKCHEHTVINMTRNITEYRANTKRINREIKKARSK